MKFTTVFTSLALVACALSGASAAPIEGNEEVANARRDVLLRELAKQGVDGGDSDRLRPSRIPLEKLGLLKPGESLLFPGGGRRPPIRPKRRRPFGPPRRPTKLPKPTTAPKPPPQEPTVPEPGPAPSEGPAEEVAEAVAEATDA